ncbi:MAG: putative transrane protein, partial [Solimicrobium sp.]|nr:putative transrane protein [Solimicrobium sp.]
MSQELTFDSKLESIKNFAWWFYIFHAFSMLFTLGALSFIPVFLSYIKRRDAVGTFVYSHHNWQISSFWIYLACVLIGWLLFITLLGIPLAFVLWTGAWLWKAYRLIIGIIA